MCTDDAPERPRRPRLRVEDFVTAAQLAQMCGVSRARIYEIRTARDEGRGHEDFPEEALPGYWYADEAQEYARTRKRQPGPARRRK